VLLIISLKLQARAALLDTSHWTLPPPIRQSSTYVHYRTGPYGVLDGAFPPGTEHMSPIPVAVYHPAFAVFLDKIQNQTSVEKVYVDQALELMNYATSLCAGSLVQQLLRGPSKLMQDSVPNHTGIYQNPAADFIIYERVDSLCGGTAALAIYDKSDVGSDSEASDRLIHMYAQHWSAQEVLLIYLPRSIRIDVSKSECFNLVSVPHSLCLFSAHYSAFLASL
jgi:hypothetical protein